MSLPSYPGYLRPREEMELDSWRDEWPELPLLIERELGAEKLCAGRDTTAGADRVTGADCVTGADRVTGAERVSDMEERIGVDTTGDRDDHVRVEGAVTDTDRGASTFLTRVVAGSETGAVYVGVETLTSRRNVEGTPVRAVGVVVVGAMRDVERGLSVFTRDDVMERTGV